MTDSYRPDQPWLDPRRFEYSPVDDVWASVWLETPLAPGVGRPEAPVLAVRCAAAEILHSAFISATARLREDGTRPVPGGLPDVVPGYVLWRARFAVALDVLEFPDALFTLKSSNGVAMALPAPTSLDEIAEVAGFKLKFDAYGAVATRARRHAAALAAGFAVAWVPATIATAGAVSPTSTVQASDPSTDQTTTTDTTATPATTTDSTPAPAPTTDSTATPPPPATTTSTAPTPTPSTPPPAAPATTTSTLASAPPTPVSATAPTTPVSVKTAAPAAPPPRTGGATLPEAAKLPGSPKSTSKPGAGARCKIPVQRAAKLSKKALAKLMRAEKARCDPNAKDKAGKKGKALKRRKSAIGGVAGAGSGGAQRSTATTTAAPATPAGFVWNGGNELLNAQLTASELAAISYVGAHDRPPRFLIPMYKAASRRYHVPWQILAAINAIETDYGRNLSVSSAGARGWMQFMPGTWQEWGITAHGNGTPNPYNPADAIFSAARYLHASGAPRHMRRAIYAYNHATWYVDEVVWTAQSIMDRGRHKNKKVRAKIGAMRTMATILNGEPYIWGAGHGGWGIDVGYDCSGFVSAVLHAAGYLTTPVTTQTLSSQPGIVAGPGRYVTMFDRTDGGSLAEDHVIIYLNGQWWESGGSEADGGVHRMRLKDVTPSYLATFNQILHPKGL